MAQTVLELCHKNTDNSYIPLHLAKKNLYFVADGRKSPTFIAPKTASQ
jgi:hypothetical protein